MNSYLDDRCYSKLVSLLRHVFQILADNNKNKNDDTDYNDDEQQQQQKAVLVLVPQEEDLKNCATLIYV